MNVPLRGKSLQVVEEMVAKGYANTKSEAIRLAVMTFGLKNFKEEELVRMKMDFMDAQVDEGRAKLLNSEEALGKYSKYLKTK